MRGVGRSAYGGRGRAILSRLDAQGHPVGRPTRLGPALVALPRIAVGAGAAWVANAPTGTITRIDPDDGAVSRVRVPVRR